MRHAVRQGVLHPRAGPAAAPASAPPRSTRAAPAPFLGAPPHARLAHGRLRLLNREVAFGGPIDWHHADQGPLWAFHLHQFDWARDPELPAFFRRAAVLDWIENHRAGVGWLPGPISLRALSWLKLLLTPGALELKPEDEERVRASLAAQFDTLARHLEIRLLANHYLSNLLALAAGGLAFDGPAADAWLRHVPALRGELDEQVLPDGAHFERSPMYHALLLENVLDVLDLARAAPRRAPAGLAEALEAAAAHMLGALEVYTHPDGEIALFGDSAFGIAQHPAAVHRYAGQLGVAPRRPSRPGVLDAAGYVRLAAGPWSALVSVAGPGPAYQPGHAHGDALAFELCVGEERVVTDTGVYEYAPGPRRDAARATASHATAEVDGRDQAEFWAAHRVGGRPDVRLLTVEPGRRVEATCAGWATRDTRHRRVLEVSEEALVVTDALEGRTRPARLRLPLAPGLAPALEGARARVPLASGGRLELELPAGARWGLEHAEAFPEFGLAVERAVLVGETRGPGPFVVRLRRSG